MGKQLTPLLQACEARLGIAITVVDYHGLFHDQRNRPVLGKDWQSHRTCKACDLGFGAECVAHCRWQVGERLAKRGEPYVTRCWKGLREIACPIQWNQCHLGTLFAGTWRQHSRPDRTRQLSDEWYRSWKSLPVWEDQDHASLIPVLSLVATGLAEQLAKTALQPSSGEGLKTTISNFIRLHSHLPIRLGDLAEHIGRSVSRTGAIVRELFDSPFANLVLQQRIQAAKNLLRHGHLHIGDVARAVGFTDPLYFSRQFKNSVGMSPRAWRSQG